jgi:hypothetical protein
MFFLCSTIAMADSSNPLAPPAAAEGAPPAPFHLAPVTVDPDPGITPYIDEHGFDPTEFRWVPVRRKPRKDGWSEAKQRLFIEVLADTACVGKAAAAVGMTKQSAYALRRAPGGEAFAAAWTAALHQAAQRLADIAFERAFEGYEVPVFNSDGRVIGHKLRYSERLMMFLMRAHMPERYAFAHHAERPQDAPPPVQTEPVAKALARLEPAAPEKPHELMPPDELDELVQVADMLDGKLPHYYRPEPPEPVLMPLGAELERRLEAAKFGIDLDDEGNPV